MYFHVPLVVFIIDVKNTPYIPAKVAFTVKCYFLMTINLRFNSISSPHLNKYYLVYFRVFIARKPQCKEQTERESAID